MKYRIFFSVLLGLMVAFSSLQPLEAEAAARTSTSSKQAAKKKPQKRAAAKKTVKAPVAKKRVKRSMGMKYSTLSPFVKSNSKNFSIFFKSTAQAAFQLPERNGIVIYHTFRICQTGFVKKSVFFPDRTEKHAVSGCGLFRIRAPQMTDHQLGFELGNRIFSLAPQGQHPRMVRQQG